MRPPYSIQWRLFQVSIALAALLVMAAWWVVNGYSSKASQASFDRLLAGAALQMADRVSVKQSTIGLDIPLSAFESLAQAKFDRVFYLVVSDHQGILTGYDNLPRNPDAESEAKRLSLHQKPTPVFYSEPFSDEEVRFSVLYSPINEPDYQDGVTIILGQTQQARIQMADALSTRGVQVVIPAVLVGLALAMIGVWYALRPIRELNKSLAARSSLDLTPLELDAPAEVQPLVQTLNQFMHRLSGTLDRLKSLTSEAAHQLKTPLAGLRSQAENALTETDPVQQQRQIQNMIQCCDLLNSTASQLLNQATLTHRFQRQPKEPVELCELVKNTCRTLAVAALKNGIHIEYEGDSSAYIQGDAFALNQMIQSIVENAVKYSPIHSQVLASVQSIDSRISLSITDAGAGIPDEEKLLVFERFYRTKKNTRPGSGLGLTIAKEVASHHQAALTLLDNHPTGLIVRIDFPALATTQPGGARQ